MGESNKQRRNNLSNELYKIVQQQLESFNPEFWTGNEVDGERRNLNVMEVFYILENSLKTKGSDSIVNRALNSPTAVEHIFRTFCTDFLAMYNKMFINREPDEFEKDKIQRSYLSKGLPGCIGTIGTISFNTEGKESTRDDTKRFEVWLDTRNFCWFINNVREFDVMEAEDLYLVTSLRTKLWNGSITMSTKEYTINDHGVQRRGYYFIAEDNMPLWNIFVPPASCSRTRSDKNLYEVIKGEEERRLNYNKYLKETFKLLTCIPSTFDIFLVQDVVKVCVILNNLSIRLEEDRNKSYLEVEDENVVAVGNHENSERRVGGIVEGNENIMDERNVNHNDDGENEECVHLVNGRLEYKDEFNYPYSPEVLSSEESDKEEEDNDEEFYVKSDDENGTFVIIQELKRRHNK